MVSNIYIYITLLGQGLIKINTELANFNNPRPSLILNCWKAKLERTYSFRVQCGKITVCMARYKKLPYVMNVKIKFP